MNEKKSTWMCPVCDKDADYKTLTIDGYVLYCTVLYCTVRALGSRMEIWMTRTPQILQDSGMDGNKCCRTCK